MGVAVGRDDLHRIFTIVFVVMLAAVPLFGWIASRFSRRLVLPGVFTFFAVNLVAFWFALRRDGSGEAVAVTFFVWASVFNLFVVSLFWSLMSELWTEHEAKRLYGFISAGGTAGALAGPALTQVLIAYFTAADLLLVSAALLIAAVGASLILRRVHPASGGGETQPAGGGILDGAAKVFASPYLGRIALYVFLANVVGTFFYLEQSRLVAATIADSTARMKFFSSRDLAVSVATLLIQVFGTAQIMQRLGITTALLALPVVATFATLTLAYDPVLAIVAAAMVAERVVSFSLANPGIKVMYTLTLPDEKYKVQNFIDTVVYRGGDAASGWLFSAIGGGAGFAAMATPLVALSLAAVWLFTALGLGRVHDARTRVLEPDI
jgi:AAA family ATP:ADP antiporter